MNLAYEYIKYQWKAKKRHGIHSPFVYDLSDKCLALRKIQNEEIKLKALCRELKNNKHEIEIADFGAGSKKLSDKRQISRIYKTSSSKGRYGHLLFQLSKYYKPKSILEFGTSLGIGTINLALGNPEAKITTVEGCHETRSVANENFKKTGLTNIQSIESTFIDYIQTMKDVHFDMVFIDGHHDGESLLKYMEALIPFTHTETLFILDDIRWSDGMFEAWNHLVSDKQFHLTIDFFRMGIVIPRPNQRKEHFILRR